MAKDTGVLPEPINDFMNLFEVHPRVRCLHVDLEERMTENAFAEAPAIRVGCLREYELFRRCIRYVFGDVIRIAAGVAQKSRQETNEQAKAKA